MEIMLFGSDRLFRIKKTEIKYTRHLNLPPLFLSKKYFTKFVKRERIEFPVRLSSKILRTRSLFI